MLEFHIATLSEAKAHGSSGTIGICLAEEILVTSFSHTLSIRPQGL